MKQMVYTAMALATCITLGCKQDPRPVDTTDPAVFEGDGAKLDYCDLQPLDGSNLNADEIPKAYTPGNGYETFPMPILADCTEPVIEGGTDMRGLWISEDGKHIERIEQCGNRMVVTSAGVIHDFMMDGTLENGANDINPQGQRIRASAIWEDGAVVMDPHNRPGKVVRKLEGEQMLWEHPIAGEVTNNRLCYFPGYEPSEDE